LVHVFCEIDPFFLDYSRLNIDLLNLRFNFLRFHLVHKRGEILLHSRELWCTQLVHEVSEVKAFVTLFALRSFYFFRCLLFNNRFLFLNRFFNDNAHHWLKLLLESFKMRLNEILMADLNLRLHYAVKRILDDVLRLVRLTLTPIMILTLLVSVYSHQVESLERHPEHDSDVGIDIIAKEVVVHNSIPPLDVFIRVTVLV